uniref:Uncharacterized protein n=1 Tax=Arundo donax TaxID=35708 RepID=A0A0A9AMJ4_ARUDO
MRPSACARLWRAPSPTFPSGRAAPCSLYVSLYKKATIGFAASFRALSTMSRPVSTLASPPPPSSSPTPAERRRARSPPTASFLPFSSRPERRIAVRNSPTSSPLSPGHGSTVATATPVLVVTPPSFISGQAEPSYRLLGAVRCRSTLSPSRPPTGWPPSPSTEAAAAFPSPERAPHCIAAPGGFTHGLTAAQ